MIRLLTEQWFRSEVEVNIRLGMYVRRADVGVDADVDEEKVIADSQAFESFVQV